MIYSKPPNTMPLGRKKNGTVFGGARYSVTGIGFFLLQYWNKNGGKNGCRVFGGRGIGIGPGRHSGVYCNWRDLRKSNM